MSAEANPDASNTITESHIEPLTHRELEILGLYAAGLNNPEVAGRLFLAESTVKWYARQIYGKLGVNDRESAVSRAYALGFLKPEAAFESLPAALTPLIGRVDELGAVQRSLLDPGCRLLTVLGPGGTGKTRLAQQAAANLAGRQPPAFRDGIAFVRLEPVSDLAAAIAGVLRLESFDESASLPAQLERFLRPQQRLLVLDNFESFAGTQQAAWLVELLSAAAGLKLLVTSRMRLNLPGEQVFPLGGLDLPPEDLPDRDDALEQAAGYGSVQLFVQAARRTRPSFDLDEKNLSAVVQICRMLEGLPLGIELAAGWIGVLSPGEILREVQTSLDFLETQLQAVPDRQRSLRAVFDASWRRLEPGGREAAKRLAVFQGGFDAGAARRIAGLSPRDLMNLANQSWIQREASGRFRFYDPLKNYILEIAAGEPGWEAVRREHSAYFCALAGEQGPRLHSPEFKQARELLRCEQDNLRAAWDWAVRRRHWELVGQALPGLGMYYRLFGRFQEGESLCASAAEEILKEPPERTGCLAAHLLTWQAVFTRDQQTTARSLEQAQSLLDRAANREETACRRVQAFLWFQTGQLAAWRDRRRAIALFERSLEIYQQLGDEQAAAEIMTALGWANRMIQQPDGAHHWLEAALEIQKRIGDAYFAAKSLTLLGIEARSRGRLRDSIRLNEEGLRLYRELETPHGLADILFVLAYVLAFVGDLEAAERRVRESLAEYARVGYEGAYLAKPYVALSFILIYKGEYEPARAAGLEGLEIARRYANPQEAAFAWYQLGLLDLLEGRKETAQEQLRESLRIFNELEHRAAVVPRAYLALLDSEQGAGEKALQALRDIAARLLKIGDIGFAINLLPSMTLCLDRAGRTDQAAEFYRLIRHFPNPFFSRVLDGALSTELADRIEEMPAGEEVELSETERAKRMIETLETLRRLPG